MSGFEPIGKILLIIGGIMVLLGLIFWLGPKIPFLGRLPGDIFIQRGNGSFFFPIVSCLAISVILTLVLNLIFRLIGK